MKILLHVNGFFIRVHGTQILSMHPSTYSITRVGSKTIMWMSSDRAEVCIEGEMISFVAAAKLRMTA